MEKCKKILESQGILLEEKSGNPIGIHVAFACAPADSRNALNMFE